MALVIQIIIVHLLPSLSLKYSDINFIIQQKTGLYRAGPVPLYMNMTCAQGATFIGKLSKMGKFLDNYFLINEVAAIGRLRIREKSRKNLHWTLNF